MSLISFRRLSIGALACSTLALAAPAPLTYPPAARGTVVDHYGATAVADPYRWLEDLDSPATRTWVDAEAALTDTYLASLTARERIRARLAKLNDYEKLGIPFREGGRYFYRHNSGLQNQSILLTRRGLNDPDTVALDPNRLSADGSAAVASYVVSRDGALLAYGVSVSGSDWTDWHIRDLATGKDRPEVIRHTKYYAPEFARDGKGLYYSAFPEPRAGAELTTRDLGNALYYHALGSPVAADHQVFVVPGHPEWQYEPHLSEDGRWLVVLAGDGEVGDKGVENLYLLDLSTPGAAPIAVAEGFDAAYVYAGADRGLLYFLTTLDAPRGRVIAVDPTRAARRYWANVIAEGRDAIDLTESSVTLVDHQLIVRTLHDAHTRVVAYGLDGTPRHELALPGPGTARGLSGHADDRETFYSFTDLITAPTIYRYDLETGASSVFRKPEVPFDPAAFEEHQLFFTARDGTRIPLTVAYRKGLVLDGRSAVLLYGYGGFGIPTLPTFAAARIAWMEMGGIYAIANIRGGGEYGEAWHRQAIRERKQVVFNDFIDAGEWLIAHHYTSNRRLAILGRSNGGLLIGACLTQRPDLYGAAIAEVGVLDMLRFDLFGQGAGWTGDYGSPHDPADFKALYAYSPVHSVRKGVHYPATMVITGDHDTRVMPMHSFKFAAALQWAQGGPAPILLRVQRASGHGGGTTVTQAIDQDADVYAFLEDNLGMKAP
jgi:prolyl oligopeptidase